MSHATIAAGSELFVVPGEFELEHGGCLRDVQIVYELVGKEAAPLVIVQGGISADAHVAANERNPATGWWDAMVGDDRAIDTRRFRVLSLDYLGGPHEAFGIALEPRIASGDQARLTALLCERLQVHEVAAFVGASYGGMVALQFAAQNVVCVRRLVLLGAAHRSTAHAIAGRALQRRVLELGFAHDAEQAALAIARGLALLGYCGNDEFDERFGGDAAAIADYFAHKGAHFATRFSAAALFRLSQAIDLHTVDPRAVRVPATIISFDSDRLVPTSLCRELAETMAAPARFENFATRFGHDAFLKEPARLSPLIARALEESFVDPMADAAPRTSAATRAVRASIATDAQHGAVVPPLYLSTNFSFSALGARRRYDYTRSGNPTRDQLAEAIADLEGAAGGVITASGMAALTVVLELAPQSGVVIAPHDCYGGTFRLLKALERRGRLRARFVRMTESDDLPLALQEGAALVLLETPSNPLLRITDLAAASALAHAAGAMVVADNTFLSPVLQRPIEHGADFVVHSTTKYLNGHSDVVGGAVLARDHAHVDELGWWANCLGVTGAPFDSFLTLRGLRTLHVRMAAHERNAQTIAEFLQSHALVRTVHYPGLPSHPGHALARRQQDGFGAMLSFELEPAPRRLERFVSALKCFTLAESLGGVESLIAHPASMTHASMDPAARAAAGITDALLRLSIGIESADDLCADLSRALAAE